MGDWLLAATPGRGGVDLCHGNPEVWRLGPELCGLLVPWARGIHWEWGIFSADQTRFQGPLSSKRGEPSECSLLAFPRLGGSPVFGTHCS
jgi:hypothetical protein